MVWSGAQLVAFRTQNIWISCSNFEFASNDDKYAQLISMFLFMWFLISDLYKNRFSPASELDYVNQV